MTAPDITAEATEAKLPKRPPRSRKAPEPAVSEPEAAAAEPETEAPPEHPPLRYRDYNAVLDERYPLTVAITPGLPVALIDDGPVAIGEVIFTGAVMETAGRDTKAEGDNQYADFLAETRAYADYEAHKQVHAGRPVHGEECVYADAYRNATGWWSGQGEQPEQHHEAA